MSGAWPFSAESGLIHVSARIVGPAGSGILDLILDTGASHTFIRIERIRELGYSPERSPNKVRVATAGGDLYSPVLEVSRFEALGRFREGFSVTAVELPDSTKIDGVIGLDWLRGTELKIDFREGLLRLR